MTIEIHKKGRMHITTICVRPFLLETRYALSGSNSDLSWLQPDMSEDEQILQELSGQYDPEVLHGAMLFEGSYPATDMKGGSEKYPNRIRKACSFSCNIAQFPAIFYECGRNHPNRSDMGAD